MEMELELNIEIEELEDKVAPGQPDVWAIVFSHVSDGSGGGIPSNVFKDTIQSHLPRGG